MLCVLVVAGALWIAGAWPGSPAGAADTGRGGIDVVQVNGPLDPPNVSLVRSVIREANRKGSTLVVIQLDSPGVVDSDVAPVVRAIRDSGVPIAVWVGPAGSNAKGGAVELVAAAQPGPLGLPRPGEHLLGQRRPVVR